jgi:hypothetical protein
MKLISWVVLRPKAKGMQRVELSGKHYASIQEYHISNLMLFNALIMKLIFMGCFVRGPRQRYVAGRIVRKHYASIWEYHIPMLFNAHYEIDFHVLFCPGAG